MDPITAAGIGLSVSSLALQLFSGCIKGYQLFLECKDMPVKYEHMRTRLRIEQERHLHWGEILGLVEERIDEPNQLLKRSHSLILEIEQQVQVAFRSSLVVTTKYDPYLKGPAVSPNKQHESTLSNANASSFLQKTLAFWDKAGRVAGRIEWSMLKKDGFERLLGEVIEWNNKAASVLDQTALTDLHKAQTQSNLMLLQVTDQISELRDLVLALQIGSNASSLSEVSTLAADKTSGDSNLLNLASFKQYELSVFGGHLTENKLIPFKELEFDIGKMKSRQTGTWHGRKIWLEWRDDFPDFALPGEYTAIVESRVQKLAMLLSASKPKSFHAPHCLGYVRADEHDKTSIALVFEMPVTSELVSLRTLFGRIRVSLNGRLALARSLTESLLNLHAVNWIHKGVCSDNILFAVIDGHYSLAQPILSGFETSRPAALEEITMPHLSTVERDLYRHPDLLLPGGQRSKRSHDVYSLGLVLAEIAFWKPIEQVVELQEVKRRALDKVRANMLDPELYVIDDIAEKVGWRYADAVRACVAVSVADDTERPLARAAMIESYYRDVVLRLKSINV